jgi:hypothetical protein
MNTYITIGGVKWEMMLNGTKGVMLTRYNPVRVQFLDCLPGESSQDIYDRLLNLEAAE